MSKDRMKQGMRDMAQNNRGGNEGVRSKMNGEKGKSKPGSTTKRGSTSKA